MVDLPQILIRPHLGAGDMIVCNALFRHYANSYQVRIPCKIHNVPTVAWMLRDLENVTVLPVEGDAEADHFCKIVAKEGHRVLKLGMFGEQPWNPQDWDRCHYAQAKVPFQQRWDGFKVVREPNRELPAPEGPFCFIHEDPARGFVIDRSRLPQDMPLVFVEPGVTPNLFDWWGFVENATELHLIDSCFAILADSLPKLKARRKVIHLYARAGALPPSYQSGWEILRK